METLAFLSKQIFWLLPQFLHLGAVDGISSSLALPVSSVVHTVLYEMAAAKVEARRVDVVKSHGLLNKSDCFLSSYSLGASMELLIIALSDSSLIRLLDEGTTCVSSPMSYLEQDLSVVFFQYI